MSPAWPFIAAAVPPRAAHAAAEGGPGRRRHGGRCRSGVALRPALSFRSPQPGPRSRGSLGRVFRSSGPGAGAGAAGVRRGRAAISRRRAGRALGSPARSPHGGRAGPRVPARSRGAGPPALEMGPAAAAHASTDSGELLHGILQHTLKCFQRGVRAAAHSRESAKHGVSSLPRGRCSRRCHRVVRDVAHPLGTAAASVAAAGPATERGLKWSQSVRGQGAGEGAKP